MKKEGLVDSNILIDYDKLIDSAIDWWERMLVDGWDLSISVVTLMELLKGIANLAGKRNNVLVDFRSRVKKMRKESKIKRVYQITEPISRKAHRLLDTYCLHHTPPSTDRSIEGLICDMLIAATAIEHGVVLFTHNRRDFEWIKGYCNSFKLCEPDYS